MRAVNRLVRLWLALGPWLARWGSLPAMAIAVVTTAVLCMPVLFLMFGGNSLVPRQEESAGYRYFYTLRILYEPEGSPILPQGQLPGLFFVIIQVVLTALGLDPVSLHPRIEYFTYAAAMLPYVATGLSLYYLLRTFSSLSAMLLTVSSVIVALVVTTPHGHTTLFRPDYNAWLAPIIVCSFLMIQRHLDAPTRVDRLVWPSMILAGVCAAFKPSFAFCALAVALFSVFHHFEAQRFFGALEHFLYGAVLAVITFLGITFVYYGFRVSLVVAHIEYVLAFGETRAAAQNEFSNWLMLLVSSDLSLSALVLVLVPMLIACASLDLWRTRSISLALLPGMALTLLALYLRPTEATSLEANLYSLFAVACLVRTMMRHGALTAVAARYPVRAIAAIMVVLALTSVLDELRVQVPVHARASTASVALSDHLRTADGPILVLVLDNEWRTLTDMHAAFKGGTFATSAGSPLVRRIVPRVDFVYTGQHIPREMDDYVFVVFGRPRGVTLDGAARILEANLEVDLSGHTCEREFDSGFATTITLCHRNDSAA